MTRPALVWCPFPDTASAEAAAATMLDEGLVACVNLIPGMRSFYVWQGAREAGSETGALFKTNEDLRDEVVARLAALHPYDEPAILAWDCDGSSPATAAWLGGLSAG